MSTCSSSVSDRQSQAHWASQLNKSYYQDDQQAKFMHLQAEIDSLLLQLQNLKQQRLSTASHEE
ncbi:MAG: hypothetical protein KME32_15245 [Mojavia pulchra JT2-VF2]|jgi:hypothetical protein|uniref:Uncharacterized protein n=1 Tax=Mojavia pulchra JT2-VF2 TaxID=287848 RepID=A0A951UGD6_9NOST|nr:hypothetical protein [Mojavia pulchra JT2-VF2]